MRWPECRVAERHRVRPASEYRRCLFLVPGVVPVSPRTNDVELLTTSLFKAVSVVKWYPPLRRLTFLATCAVLMKIL